MIRPLLVTATLISDAPVLVRAIILFGVPVIPWVSFNLYPPVILNAWLLAEDWRMIAAVACFVSSVLWTALSFFLTLWAGTESDLRNGRYAKK